MYKATTVDDPGRKYTESGPQTKESLETSKTTESVLPDPAHIDVETEMQMEVGCKREPKPFDEKTIREIITKRVKNASYESIHDPATEQVGSNVRENMRDATPLLAYIEILEETVAHLQNQAAAPDSMTPKPSLEPATGTSSIEQSWNMEVKRWKRIRDTQRDEVDLIDDTKSIQDCWRATKRENNHVLTIFREYDKKTQNTHYGTTLEVNSPLLVNSLQKAIGQYPGDAFQSLFSDVVAIPEPYVMLFHNRLKIQKEMELVAGERKEHLQLLLSFLKEQLPVASQKLDEIEHGTLVEIGYEEQWLLYSPGSVVYTEEDREGRALKVRMLRDYKKSANGLFIPIELECAFMQFDKNGRELEQLFSRYRLAPFAGSHLLKALQFIPAEHIPDKEQVREALIARGLIYWSYRSEAHFREYSRDAGLNSQERIRVMIDYSTSSKCPVVNFQNQTYGQKCSHVIYSRAGFSGGVPGCGCFECDAQRESRVTVGDYVRHEYMQERVTDPESSPECFMFCPAVIMAFSLKDKEWKPVKIIHLSEVSFRDDSFRTLVIKKKHKTVVTAMVRSYLSKEHGFSDVIQSKGRGLVVLLHGSPGTGKTLTAECVAEKENSPLYMVTCGDLGTHPDTMENKLKTIFEYAFNWNAVLLLDEADVFLQERDLHDLKRNALVSIFLRHLEYFDGILFLTTNRPGALDEAFQSRIHVTIGLPDLDVNSQLKVWGIFVRKLDIPHEEKAAIMSFVTDDIKRHGNLNGRQIRNTVRAALALALQKREPINKSDIGDVLEIGRDFTKYMEDVNRMNQEQRAFALGHRKLPDAN